jgi:hypothetical protein
MPYYVRGGVRYWVGTHRAFGPVVFDPEAQAGLRSLWVRLFIPSEDRMETFAAHVVRPFVSSEGSDLDFLRALEAYLRLRNRREATCFRCHLDLSSSDDSVCADCGWLRCTCGACGCNYARDDAHL